MSEEKILENIDELDSNQVAIEKKKFTFKGFFKSKKNIFALGAFVFGLLAIVLFLVCPAIAIDLTKDGKAVASNNAATIPTMASYREVFSGLTVLLGNVSYAVWHNVGPSAVEETQQMAFNIPLLIGLVLIFAGIVMNAICLFLNKSGLVNKIILGLLVCGSIMVLLAPVWFYAINPITASTRYDTQKTVYPYGSINAHSQIGTVLGALFGVISSVFAGLLLPKPVETR